MMSGELYLAGEKKAAQSGDYRENFIEKWFVRSREGFNKDHVK